VVENFGFVAGWSIAGSVRWWTIWSEMESDSTTSNTRE
jgi:hypothetical protein